MQWRIIYFKQYVETNAPASPFLFRNFTFIFWNNYDNAQVGKCRWMYPQYDEMFHSERSLQLIFYFLFTLLCLRPFCTVHYSNEEIDAQNRDCSKGSHRIPPEVIQPFPPVKIVYHYLFKGLGVRELFNSSPKWDPQSCLWTTVPRQRGLPRCSFPNGGLVQNYHPENEFAG